MDTQNPFRILSTVLLLGASACLDEGADELLDEDLAALELEELELELLAELELTELELEELSGAGPDEIASNEPEATPVNAVNPLRSDFNGDGFADLAMGAPGRMVGGVASGAVIVSYGGPTGMNIARLPQTITILDAPGGVPTDGDEFGVALAAGDFNFDGFADLAIGAPGYDLPGGTNQGSVTIVYGSAQGLGVEAGISTPVNQLLTQRFFPETGDRYGAALAAQDFDGDADFDLAVGVPGEGSPGVAEAGLVHIYRGSPGLIGMNPLPAQTITQTSLLIFPPGIDQARDHFGAALAAGDFDGDSTHDLAIGAPGEAWAGAGEAGAVTVLYGMAGPGGPLHLGGIPGETGPQLWRQENLGQVSQKDDRFGSALVAGNFDGNPFDDLAVGVPYEDLPGATNAGAVMVIYAKSAAGLANLGAQRLDEGVLPGIPATDDRFGMSLAAGNMLPLLGTGWDDLVVGVPGKDLGVGLENAGWIHIIPSSLVVVPPAVLPGLQPISVIRTRATLAAGPDQAGAEFGSALATGDYNGNTGNGLADLAVSSPLRDVGLIQNAGEVVVKFDAVLTGTIPQVLDGATMAIGAATNDKLGAALPTAH